MQLQIKKATRLSKKIKFAIIGTAGSGKTYSALAIAKGLGEKVLVVDTEHGSASAYAEFGFDTIELESFAPQTYVQAIQMAETEGYDVVILDSLTHAWSGKDGALEMVDKAGRRAQSGNSFAAWRDVTPAHNEMVEKIVGAKCHVIATLRAKTDYVMEQGKNGKTAPRKVGLAPIQRDGMEYEFDVVGTIDQEHFLTITKSRILALTDQVIEKPGADVAETLRDWIESGSPLPIDKRQEKYNELFSVVAEIRKQGADTAFYDRFNNRQSVEVLQKAIDHAESALATAIDTKAKAKPPRNLGVNERPTLTTEVAKARTKPVSPEEQAEVDKHFPDPEPEQAAPLPQNPSLITEAQQRAIIAVAGRVFGRHERDNELAKMLNGAALEEMTKAEGSTLLDSLRKMANDAAETALNADPLKMTDGQRRMVFKLGTEIWGKEESEAKIHELVLEMFKKESLTTLSKNEAVGLIERLNQIAQEQYDASTDSDPFSEESDSTGTDSEVSG
jgi:hypothetical protein